jgi:ABC-type uncharacterized transport system permease subunit
MNDYNANLEQLLRSRSRSAQLFGLAAVLFTFIPTVCQVADDASLSFWQRVERVSLALVNTTLLIGSAAANPEAIVGKEKPPSE